MRNISLGEVTTRVRSMDPAKSGVDEFVYIDLSSVDQSTKTINDVKMLPSSEAPSRARQIVAERDVLVSTVRPNLNGVAKIHSNLDGAVASTGFTVLRTIPSELDSSYLFHWVKSPDFIADMVSKSTGASYPAISDRIVRESRLPLPPFEEQRRIAAILDKADELRAKRRKAIAHLDTLTQSIFHSMFGDPTRDSKWGSARLDDLGRWQSGGTPSRSVPAYFSGTIPWYSSGELGERRLGASAERINQAALSSSSAKMIPPGALLLGMYDTAALKSGITSVPSACNQAIAFSKLNDRVVTDYVYYAIQIGRSHFMRLQRGVRQKNLSLSMIRALRVPVPPIELQQTFATRVAAVERLKETHRKHLAELDALFASLQSRAFKGEL